MLAGKFHFIFYFYLLINNSVSIRHCNNQPCSHINGSYLLNLTNYIKAKCLYEVIFFVYSISYLDHSVHSPHPLFLLESWAFYQIFKNGGLTGPQFLMGIAGKEQGDFFQGLEFLHKKNRLISEIFNGKRSL